MFALVALLCLYMATGNMTKAFAVPFSQWETINWSLFLTAVPLFLTAGICTWQAVKDFNKAKAAAQEKKDQEISARKAQYLFDEVEEAVPEIELEEAVPETEEKDD